MAERLSDDAIAAGLRERAEWRLEEKTIWRRYRFDSFPNAMRFANGVADIAEARNHHPFLSIDFKVVTIRLTSWHAGGLTEDDFAEAEAIDSLYDGMQRPS